MGTQVEAVFIMQHYASTLYAMALYVSLSQAIWCRCERNFLQLI